MDAGVTGVYEKMMFAGIVVVLVIGTIIGFGLSYVF